ncbi:hypothetical protein WR25_08881 [Diploscapter pachys]|uniref:Innexin n=1 Tax=Diploscapter pachys TaxID=2018661 RepID=A0A2A2JBK6_9BILA|nr:hypothetical protein WR25_08881 [Diploscapter pachys]
MVLAAVLSMLRYVAGSEDRDFVDRLHSYFTCNILIGLAVLWVPFFLLLEAACFRLPSFLWKYLGSHSGIKIHEIIKLSSDTNNIKPEIKRANIKSLSTHLLGALRFHRRLHKKQIRPHRLMRLFNLPYSAFFVTSMYICTKFFYLSNVCLQLLLMNRFLETNDYSWYGFGAMVDLVQGKTWQQSGVFPRVSLCDIDIRVMGNVQQHTIQCVLVINIFNEKIFIFLWFWYLLLVFFTAGSFIYWLVIALVPYPNRRFLCRHLEMSDIPFDPETQEDQVIRFIDNYLKSDGIFVIRMVTLQSGVIFGTDLVQELWRSAYGDTVLKRSNSNPNLKSETVHPPPSPPSSSYRYNKQNEKNADELRMRKALGFNINNSFTTQHLLERLIPPDKEYKTHG